MIIESRDIFYSFGVREQLSIPDVDQVTIARFLNLKQAITFSGPYCPHANRDVEPVAEEFS